MMGGVGPLAKDGLSDLGFLEPEGRRLRTSLGSERFSNMPWPSCPLMLRPQL